MDEIEFEKGQKMKNILARTMGLLLLVISFAIIPAAQAAPAPCGAHGDKNTMLVSTSWLADHLNDPNVVVIVVWNKADFDKGHIPGSVFMRFHGFAFDDGADGADDGASADEPACGNIWQTGSDE